MNWTLRFAILFAFRSVKYKFFLRYTQVLLMEHTVQ